MPKPIHHVLPVDDLAPHVETGLRCPCDPQVREYDYGIVVIHNSYDGREHWERLPGWLNAPRDPQ